MFDIRQDDLSGGPTRALLALHLAGMHENTPREHVFALDLSGLQAPGVTLWSVWDAGEIAGIGALKSLGDGTGEVKSMRTAPASRGQGIGRALLPHIIAEATVRSYTRLSLETGNTEPFQPALQLYASEGFEPWGPFGEYKEIPFSSFLTRRL